jgi:UDP-N-acetylglucosamine 2-epimerase
VRGDTNSTLAGALAAAKLNIPVVHVEAGERSYDNTMPEEINRLLTDRIASLHLCASKTAIWRLEKEGIQDAVYWVGDVMLDALDQNLPHSRERSTVLTDLGLQKGQYSLVTIHRQGNTDNPGRMASIIEALNCAQERIIFPAHPRTRAAMMRYGLSVEDHVTIIPPVSYYDMLALEENARLIATDSGGVQREAYFLGVPCLTLRDQTEWVETVSVGWNRIVGARTGAILSAWRSFTPASIQPPIFGDGHAAERIASILEVYSSYMYRHLDTRLFSKLPADISQL